jgi:hypothetical protein
MSAPKMQLPLAEKCPMLPAVAGISSNPCCLSDNRCGFDGSSLNRGCLSYAEVKSYYHFATPPERMCDGTLVPTSAAAGSSGGMASAAGGGAAGTSAGQAGAGTAGAKAGAGSAGTASTATAGSKASAGAGGH